MLSACGSASGDDTTTTTTTAGTTTTTEFVPGTLAESFVDRYRSDALGFSIGFPVDWEVDDQTQDGAVGFFARPVDGDTFRENYTLVASDVGQEVTLEQFAQIDAARVSGGIDGYAAVGAGETTLDGAAALTVVFDGVAEGVELRFFRLVSVHEGRAYEFAFIANREEFDNFLPVVDQMLSTFEFRG